jgi:PIN domain nuclease of toxin-antitoxin system
MAGIVVDTHALVWYLFSSKRLSVAAFSAIEEALRNGEPVCVSAISVVELIYLVEKGRLPRDFLVGVQGVLNDPESGFVPVPLDAIVATRVEQVPREIVPDLPDRVVAATALQLGLALVTCDSQIQATKLPTIW